VLARDTAVLWRRSAGTLLLKRRDSPAIIYLDETALALWEELDRPRTVEELALRLGDRYSAPADVVLADLLPVVDELERRRLVNRRHA